VEKPICGSECVSERTSRKWDESWNRKIMWYMILPLSGEICAISSYQIQKWNPWTLEFQCQCEFAPWCSWEGISPLHMKSLHSLRHFRGHSMRFLHLILPSIDSLIYFAVCPSAIQISLIITFGRRFEIEWGNNSLSFRSTSRLIGSSNHISSINRKK
jgi:hypothetical protein